MVSQRARLIRQVLLVWGAIGCALAGQLAVNVHLKPLRPVVDELPFPPSPLAMKALALGDNQFLFRALISWLQDFGDGGGRLRPLGEYDYQRIVDWLRGTDALDSKSDSLFLLGSTYFGAISDKVTAPPRLKLLAEYFMQAGLADLPNRSPWVVWAAVKIQHTVGDPMLARQMAEELLALQGNPQAPPWFPLLAIALYRAAGDKETAQTLEMRPDLAALRKKILSDFSSRINTDE